MTNKLDIEMEQLKFEEWARKRVGASLSFMQSARGYICDTTARMFDVWLARAELESKQEWVSVGNLAPDSEDQFFDVWLKSKDNPGYGRRCTGILFREGKFDLPLYSMEYVSHYMPEPQPPEAKDD